MPATEARPLASVWIPSYNHARFLPAAIESVLGQTQADLELVIVDDGSTDDSLAIARRYAAADGRVSVHTHPDGANHGVSATANLAFSLTRGSFLAGFASDDVLYPDRLERQIGLLEARPEVGFALGAVDRIDDEGRSLGRRVGTDPATFRDPLQELLLRNYVPAMAVLWRREAFERTGRFEEGLAYSDWEFTIRLFATAQPAFLGGGAVAQQRFHGTSTSLATDERTDAQRTLDVFRVLERKGATLPGRLAEPRLRALVSLQRAWYASRVGEPDEGAEAIRAAFDVDPALASDTGFLRSWLLAQEPEPSRPNGLPRTGGTAAAVAALAAAGSTRAWFAITASDRLAPATAAALRRRVLAWELNAAARTVGRPAVASALACVAQDPALVGERPLLTALVRGLLGGSRLARG